MLVKMWEKGRPLISSVLAVGAEQPSLDMLGPDVFSELWVSGWVLVQVWRGADSSEAR